MTDQPKPDKDETPEGYQPPSYIPAQESTFLRRRRRPRRRSSSSRATASSRPERRARRASSHGGSPRRRTTASPRIRTARRHRTPSSRTPSRPTVRRASSLRASRPQPYGAPAAVRPAGHTVQRLRPAGLLRRAAGTQGPEHRQPVLRHRRLRGTGLLPPAAARGGHPGAHGPQARAVRQGHGHCRPGDGLRGDRADRPGIRAHRGGTGRRQRQPTGRPAPSLRRRT